MHRKGIVEYRRSEKGNTYISVGSVIDPKAIGCPKCDTIYLQLVRDDKEVLFMAVTPEEANIIGGLLKTVAWVS